MRRFLCALTLAAGVCLAPTPAAASPLRTQGEDYHDAVGEEREAERRAERNGVLLFGMIAAVVGGAALYQWGQEIKEMFAPLFRRRQAAVVLLPVRDENKYDTDF
jgi:hypothetical protein